MVKKEIKLLEHQIERLTASDFEFDAWKKYSIIILSRIFGSNDDKIKQLDNIDFEFNSWSLRDASGNESYEENSKKLAAEVLKAAIDELSIYGLPQKNTDTIAVEEILDIILDEFKGSKVKELKAIVNSSESHEEKQRKVKELVAELGEYTGYDIIMKILTNDTLKGLL